MGQYPYSQMNWSGEYTPQVPPPAPMVRADKVPGLWLALGWVCMAVALLQLGWTAAIELPHDLEDRSRSLAARKVDNTPNMQLALSDGRIVKQRVLPGPRYTGPVIAPDASTPADKFLAEQFLLHAPRRSRNELQYNALHDIIQNNAKNLFKGMASPLTRQSLEEQVRQVENCPIPNQPVMGGDAYFILPGGKMIFRDSGEVVLALNDGAQVVPNGPDSIGPVHEMAQKFHSLFSWATAEQIGTLIKLDQNSPLTIRAYNNTSATTTWSNISSGPNVVVPLANSEEWEIFPDGYAQRTTLPVPVSPYPPSSPPMPKIGIQPTFDLDYIQCLLNIDYLSMLIALLLGFCGLMMVVRSGMGRGMAWVYLGIKLPLIILEIVVSVSMYRAMMSDPKNKDLFPELGSLFSTGVMFKGVASMILPVGMIIVMILPGIRRWTLGVSQVRTPAVLSRWGAPIAKRRWLSAILFTALAGAAACMAIAMLATGEFSTFSVVLTCLICIYICELALAGAVFMVQAVPKFIPTIRPAIIVSGLAMLFILTPRAQADMTLSLEEQSKQCTQEAQAVLSSPNVIDKIQDLQQKGLSSLPVLIEISASEKKEISYPAIKSVWSLIPARPILSYVARSKAKLASKAWIAAAKDRNIDPKLSQEAEDLIALFDLETRDDFYQAIMETDLNKPNLYSDRWMLMANIAQKMTNDTYKAPSFPGTGFGLAMNSMNENYQPPNATEIFKNFSTYFKYSESVLKEELKLGTYNNRLQIAMIYAYTDVPCDPVIREQFRVIAAADPRLNNEPPVKRLLVDFASDSKTVYWTPTAAPIPYNPKNHESAPDIPEPKSETHISPFVWISILCLLLLFALAGAVFLGRAHFVYQAANAPPEPVTLS